ncbi:hypothetical protein [Streptomyces sp. I05A-00742]|uniref:hypothetical protein n=1 Tax=Streptomyces sp. I05A-00742 TaxID=2732853 RepID=UPI001487C876|nr:hypothetical protein [Streptomyces sp. I05A-00742]
MDALRRTGLLTAVALCGTLAAGAVPALADVPPAAPPSSAAPLAPSVLTSAPLPVAEAESAADPEAVRRVSAEALRVLDQDEIGQRAAEAAAACGAVQNASAEQRGACGAVKERLDVLVGARDGLRGQAAAAAPDRAAVARIVADAQRARDELAPRTADGATDAGNGLLSLVTNLVGTLSGLVTGVLGTLTGLVGGLLG